MAMTQRSLLTRALWFVAVGWWATPVVVNASWALSATVVGAPLGIKLVNLVPTVLTLREPRPVTDPAAAVDQRSLALRALYFVVVGWWLGWLWVNLAGILAVTVVGLPLAVPMFDRLPYVTSLYRFDG
jgi:uncharacterized membrane protein YccF (DUF307 family)